MMNELTKCQIDLIEQMIAQDHVVYWELKMGGQAKYLTKLVLGKSIFSIKFNCCARSIFSVEIRDATVVTIPQIYLTQHKYAGLIILNGRSKYARNLTFTLADKPWIVLNIIMDIILKFIELRRSYFSQYMTVLHTASCRAPSATLWTGIIQINTNWLY